MATRIRKQTIAKLNQFVQIPNEWARDKRLTFKARGLLVYLTSHVDGWSISVNTLVKDGGEGRQAIEGAIKELESYGYLVRKQVRDEGGQLVGMEYVLTDPDDEDRPEADRLGGAGDHKPQPVAQNPSTGDELFGNPVDGNPVDGNPVSGKSHTKKTISSEDQGKNTTTTRRKPKTRMPEGWKPKPELATFATDLGLTPLTELDSFKSWTTAGDYLYADWDAAFRNHLIDRGKRLAQRRTGQYGQKPGLVERAEGMAEAAAELQAMMDGQQSPTQLEIGN